MIGYAVSREQLIEAVKKESNTWFERAHADTVLAIHSKTHDKTRAYWSDIKGAFIKLQHNKCAYCEKPMAQGHGQNIDYDVEHHRPKSSCEPWPSPAVRERQKINYTVKAGRSRGYPELAYHLYNYAVACKVCNSPFKSDFFPILGTAQENGNDPIELNALERPVIPMPFLAWGENPAEFLDFEGFIAVARDDDPHRRRRAEVLIDFFDLNRRADLLLGRATVVLETFNYLGQEARPTLAQDSADAKEWLAAAQAEAAPYSAVAIAFEALFRNNINRATIIARLAAEFMATMNRGLGQSFLGPLSDQSLSVEELIKLAKNLRSGPATTPA